MKNRERRQNIPPVWGGAKRSRSTPRPIRQVRPTSQHRSQKRTFQSARQPRRRGQTKKANAIPGTAVKELFQPSRPAAMEAPLREAKAVTISSTDGAPSNRTPPLRYRRQDAPAPLAEFSATSFPSTRTGGDPEPLTCGGLSAAQESH